jgi:hypothetical protein
VRAVEEKEENHIVNENNENMTMILIITSMNINERRRSYFYSLSKTYKHSDRQKDR